GWFVAPEPRLSLRSRRLSLNGMSKIHLIIVGAGGHGSEVRDYVRSLQDADRDIELLGFVDDDKPSGPWLGTEVLGPVSVLGQEGRSSATSLRYLTAVGNNRHRAALVRQIEEVTSVPLRAWSLFHPKSHIGKYVKVGGGTCLAPGSV